ncbi:hypothetical protein AGMMS50229_02160 [Campylobacterota bacterium]|nr:hypothetical protein AGMMS50229_02160 [Campylobacterota bacterium]
MKLLLSIKPEHAENILSGIKLYEFRKVIPNRAITKAVIYATKPVGKVIGEFEIGGISTDSPDKIWAATKQASGISKQFFDEYFSGRNKAHAIRAISPKRYKTPLALEAILGRSMPPQSFCYIS